MNEQTKLFEEFMNGSFLGRTLAPVTRLHASIIEFLLSVKLFTESEKYPIGELKVDFLAGAARALVAEYKDEFAAFRNDRPYFYQWSAAEHEMVVADLVSAAKTSAAFKRAVLWRLTEDRKLIFESPLYNKYVGKVQYEDHPLFSFIYWLDFIEGMKTRNVNEYRNWFELKRSLVSLVRAGNAVFERHEWSKFTVKVSQ